MATRPTPESREITATPTTMLMMAVKILLSLRHSFGIGAHGVWGGLVAEERRELRRRRLAGVFSR